MNHHFKLLLVLYAALLLSACTSTPPVIQAPEWGYEKNAIQLHLVGDPQLNLYQKKAHSLLICLYHLRDPNGFNQLVDEKDGLGKLLECNRFDPSVTYTRRVVMQPNQEINEAMDRTDGAKYVGVAAGYYNTQQNKSSTVSYQIPVTGIKKGSTFVQSTAPLTIELYLGPQNIIQIQDIPTVTATIQGKEKK